MIDVDLGLALSNLSAVEKANKKLKEDLDAKKTARLTADNAITSAEETGHDNYRSFASFQNNALEFARLEHLSTLAQEWLVTEAVEEYMLAAEKEDFYSRYTLMQQEIYIALKARDSELTSAGYVLREWLPPLS